VKAMQSTDIFTVGGSISVNAHGMDHRAGSVGETVRTMRIMLPSSFAEKTMAMLEIVVLRGDWGLPTGDWRLTEDC